MRLPVEIAVSADENRLRLIDAIVTFLVALADLRPLVVFFWMTCSGPTPTRWPC